MSIATSTRAVGRTCATTRDANRRVSASTRSSSYSHSHIGPPSSRSLQARGPRWLPRTFSVWYPRLDSIPNVKCTVDITCDNCDENVYGNLKSLSARVPGARGYSLVGGEDSQTQTVTTTHPAVGYVHNDQKLRAEWQRRSRPVRSAVPWAVRNMCLGFAESVVSSARISPGTIPWDSSSRVPIDS